MDPGCIRVGSHYRYLRRGKEHPMSGLQLWIAPVRNAVWVTAHFGHR
ncbi:MAG TPA: hypothetical protein VG476_03865 [Acidimicrobiales bacterium]|nr:hypothetical protein [Acidimicrobiales bacterium]